MEYMIQVLYSSILEIKILCNHYVKVDDLFLSKESIYLLLMTNSSYSVIPVVDSSDGHSWSTLDFYVVIHNSSLCD